MKSKSITKKRASSRKECPRADVPVRGNSPDWYTREALPYQGENFNVLTSLKSQPGVMFADGIATNAAVMHRTVIHPPIDYQDSFYKKAADFYAEIRERNSGAANYNVSYLAVYMYNVGVLHALAHTASRAFKAIRSTMSGSADSPYILSALVGIRNYEDVASRLAVLQNRYTLLAKDIENLPLPHVTAFDRSRFLYSSLFADSRNPKPSLISFVPLIVVELTYDSDVSGGIKVSSVSHSLNGSASEGGSTLDKVLTLMSDMLERITTDPTMTIIRGDIRNAFGNAAYWEGLVALPQTQLPFLVEDAEVMSQLENLSLVPRDNDAPMEVSYTMDETGAHFCLDLCIDGINDSPSFSRLWCDNNLVNYHGGKPSDGELLAITRMMYLGKKVNRLTYTDARIVASSGDTVYESLLVTGVTKNQNEFISVSSSLLQAQTSSIQSSMKAAFCNLTFAASNIAHFPMLVFDETQRGYMWNTDNYSVLSNINVANMTVIANRSLWDIHLPRGEFGRLEKRA